MCFIVKNKVFFTLFFIFLLKPSFFSNIAFLDAVFDIGRILLCVVVLGMLLGESVLNRSIRVSKATGLVFLYLILLLISTILGPSKDYQKFFLYYIPAVTIVIMLEYSIRYAIQNIFTILLPLMCILVFMNFVTTFLYPNGITTRYMGFLGMKNVQITYIIFTILLSVIWDFIKNKKCSLCTLTLLISSLINFILNESAGSLVTMTVLCFLMIIAIIFDTSIINYRNFMTIILFFFPLQNIFYVYADKYFSKGRSFLGRQTIWRSTWEIITKRLVWGYGVSSSEYRNVLMSNEFANSAHNQILEILYQGGIVLLLVYSAIILDQIKMLMKHKDNYLARQIAIVMFSFMLGTMVEVQGHHELFFAIMMIPSFYEEFIDYKMVYKKAVLVVNKIAAND